MAAPSPIARHGAAAGGHRLAALLLAGTVATACATFAVLAVTADQADPTSGDLLVVFPPGTAEATALRAAAAADGMVRRRGLLGVGWEMTSPAPGFAGRLREAGAWLVLPSSPFPSLSLGGCSFLPAETYRPRDLGKLRAGPM